MAQVKHYSEVAVAYARSLLELASETGSETQVGEELKGIGQVVEGSKSFGIYLADPAISTETRAAFIKSVFAGRVAPLVLNTILVMNEKGRIGHLAEFCEAYQAALDEKQGRVEVDVTVASELGAAELEEVRQRVNKALNKNAVIHQYVDSEIIGGLILKVGDRQIDGSVRTQLRQIRERLLLARSK